MNIYFLLFAVLVIVGIKFMVSSKTSGVSVARKDKSPIILTFKEDVNTVFKAVLKSLESDKEFLIENIDETDFTISGSTEMASYIIAEKSAVGILINVEENEGQTEVLIYGLTKLLEIGPFAHQTSNNKKIQIANSIKANILIG